MLGRGFSLRGLISDSLGRCVFVDSAGLGAKLALGRNLWAGWASKEEEEEEEGLRLEAASIDTGTPFSLLRLLMDGADVASSFSSPRI